MISPPSSSPHYETRVLLTESNLEADMINIKGHNPLHVLAIYGKENAAAICNLFIETISDFPLDKQDLDGNTGIRFENGLTIDTKIYFDKINFCFFLFRFSFIACLHERKG